MGRRGERWKEVGDERGRELTLGGPTPVLMSMVLGLREEHIPPEPE